ncbi:MAG: lamin tail domain-containing protein, partial [Thermoplasmata archaeon]|nr:lamin tail domain-containing protein [Thermoplasmata archaeon]
MNIPSESTSEPSDEPSGTQEETPLPVETGEDAIYIFLDTIPAKGYKVKGTFYADRMIEIKGQNGVITSAKYHEFDGKASEEWSWKEVGRTKAASANKEIETAVDLSGAFRTYFHLVSWNENDDWSDHVLTRTGIQVSGNRYVGTGTGTAALWHFNEVSGTNANDETSNNDGTRTADTTTGTATHELGSKIEFSDTARSMDSNDEWDGWTLKWTSGSNNDGQTATVYDFIHIAESPTRGKFIFESPGFQNDIGSGDPYKLYYGDEYGPTWTSSGKFGNALSFDGRDDYVKVLDSSSLDISSAITLEAWIYLNVNTITEMDILHKDDAYFMKIDSIGRFTGGYFYGVGTHYDVWTSSSIALKEWTHVAFTYDKSGDGCGRVWINGKIARERTGSDWQNSIYSSGNPLQIGWQTGDTLFDGYIDEVRVLNYAKTAFSGGVVINEVLYNEDSDIEWIELYNNAGSAIDLCGLTMNAKKEDGTEVQIWQQGSTGTSITAGGYYIIEPTSNYLHDTAGYIKLYDLDPGNDGTLELSEDYKSMVDFVAYGADAGAGDDHAVSAGLWKSGEYVPSVGQDLTMALLPNGDNDVPMDHWTALTHSGDVTKGYENV